MTIPVPISSLIEIQVAIQIDCLEPYAEQRVRGKPVSIILEDRIRGTTVYEGKMVRDDNVVWRVAVKFGPLTALSAEGEKYQKLWNLQGKQCVPLFYGVFVLPDRKNHGCVALEHCGALLHFQFSRLPASDRVTILNHLQKIHWEGLLHLDVHEGNVLRDSFNNYRIVDFHRVEEPPTSLISATSRRLGNLTKCDYLAVYVYDMAFYDCGYIWVYEYQVYQRPM
ncbi:hypothetical protein L218DRAFT_1002320 [Marasmius fiardii PR-910]|nr:hypothetical protein L218DRAFT_1002320 [Marasmius fiardii PR-910]